MAAAIDCKICQELVKDAYSDKYGVACDFDLDYVAQLSFFSWASAQSCEGVECSIPSFDYTPFTAVSTITCSITVDDESPSISCSITVENA